MPKKISFDMKERLDLFNDHIKEKFPNYKDVHKKLTFMTATEKETMFLEIMNKYGEKGWIINPLPIRGESGRLFHYMRKEGYIYNKSEDKE